MKYNENNNVINEIMYEKNNKEKWNNNMKKCVI